MLRNQPKKGISLKPSFRLERKVQRELQKLYERTNYLAPITLEILCKLSYQDGKFYLPRGITPHGRYLFIRALSGEIFIAKEGQVGHHSYLSNGKKVLSAGYFEFENGKMLLVSNESGHYTPTNIEMEQELKFYFEIAKNKDLIYEDHSKYPSKGIILQYLVRDIIIKNKVDITSIYKFYKPSNYGNTLQVSQSNIVSNNLPNPKKDTSHYLPDFWLLKRNSSNSEKITPSLNYKTDFFF